MLTAGLPVSTEEQIIAATAGTMAGKAMSMAATSRTEIVPAARSASMAA
jgi:hypothetical protein